ncbi:hypothetical protein LSH36_119g11046, partial [Paralvinella palmiformis]
AVVKVGVPRWTIVNQNKRTLFNIYEIFAFFRVIFMTSAILL